MIVLLVSLFLCAWIDWKTERVSVPLLLLGGMAAVLLHLFAQEESVFYLMTGMSVGIALLLYSLVTHESIGYGDGCLFVIYTLSNLLILSAQNSHLWYFSPLTFRYSAICTSSTD